MEEGEGLPLRRVEVSLTKFNEVAIPHHLDLLRQHKANIVKHERAGEWARAAAEQARARRVAGQLRALLGELSGLRARVAPQDRARFDALSSRAREATLAAVTDYLSSPPRAVPSATVGAGQPAAGSALSTDSVGVVSHAAGDEPEPAPLLQLAVNEREPSLEAREDLLRGWGELQGEVRALHDAWEHVHALAHAQGERAAAASESVQEAEGSVRAARTHLLAAERLGAGAMGAGGAALGALLGGPLGLVLGAKVGAGALLAGSALGYWAGRLAARARCRQLDEGPKMD